MKNLYYVSKRFGVVHLTKNDQGYWQDEHGTVMAIADLPVTDTVNRCGVGPFSLPEDNPLTPACTVHDWMYSSSYYQAFHTREEADEYLRHLISQNKSLFRHLSLPFYALSRVFGGLIPGKKWKKK